MTDMDDRNGAAPEAALRFTTDTGSRRPFWTATILLVAVVGWMGSGMLTSGAPTPPQQAAGDAARTQPKVVTRTSRAEPVTLTLKVEGQALPERDAMVLSEGAGRIVALTASKGDRVEAGDIIARIDDTQAQAALARAVEAKSNADREFENASRLLDRGVATTDRLSEARAARAAADADVVAAEQALRELDIQAPFDGRIEERPVSDGEHVSVGQEIARIVDNDPITVAVQVPQQALDRIEEGGAADVSFITGQTREGTISFVGAAAAAGTRTFLTEIEVANPGGAIPAGVSAGVVIPTRQAVAHFVEPSIVSLDADGRLGVKTVSDGRVDFVPVSIVRSDVDGIWVTGIGESAEIVTVGQGFVQDGEAVDVQKDPSS